jgi:glycosyltransferase involved in cell wall biosynthesis
MKFFSRQKPVATVAFNTRPIAGPYGGGNQWVTQLSRYLRSSGYEVRFDLRQPADCLVLTHAGLSGRLQFGVDEIREYKRRHPRVRVIQRINDNDRRKGTTEMNPILAETNSVTDHTVFVSEWLRDHHAQLWFDPSRPHSAILNGADPATFHPIGNRAFSAGEPLRVATHHWSDNWAKGFRDYQAVDEMIADGRLPDTELYVIGRWPKEIQWKAARTHPPCSGVALGELLRKCHVYLTGSLWEPGAMHPVEGLQCGLPLIYHEDGGGTVELGRQYGIGFRDNVAEAIQEMRSRYTEFRSAVLATPPSGDWMCLQYRRLIQRCIAEAF